MWRNKIFGKAILDIFGNSILERLVICLAYCLILSGLFVPYMEVTTAYWVNDSSYEISETIYFSSILTGKESGTFYVMLLLAVFLHISILFKDKTANVVTFVMGLLFFSLFVFFMKTVATAGWGRPCGDYTIVGFDLSVAGIIILIAYRFYVNIKRSRA
jgi:membrane associated rhomboid family serine protease